MFRYFETNHIILRINFYFWKSWIQGWIGKEFWWGIVDCDLDIRCSFLYNLEYIFFITTKHIVVFVCVFWQGFDNNLEFKKKIQKMYIYLQYFSFWNHLYIPSFNQSSMIQKVGPQKVTTRWMCIVCKRVEVGKLLLFVEPIYSSIFYIWGYENRYNMA